VTVVLLRDRAGRVDEVVALLVEAGCIGHHEQGNDRRHDQLEVQHVVEEACPQHDRHQQQHLAEVEQRLEHAFIGKRRFRFYLHSFIS